MEYVFFVAAIQLIDRPVGRLPAAVTKALEDCSMQRFFCDSCGKELVSGTDCRFVVRMESRKVCETVGLTEADLNGQDDPDHIDAMDELLASADDADENDTELELTPVSTTAAEYDLCTLCYCRFQADPLGLNRKRKMRFSPN